MIQNKKELWERTVIKVQAVTNNNGGRKYTTLNLLHLDFFNRNVPTEIN